MACYSPTRLVNRQDGSVNRVPCGQCVGCRLKRAGEWAVRGTHESSLFEHNCFLTLTIDSQRMPIRSELALPADIDLYYPDFQGFLYRLRDRYGSGIRYIMCGEYGDKRSRPHYHACFFNLNFDDKKFWYRTKQGHNVFRSKSLEDLWPFGNCDIGSVTPQSLAYVARYIMKKITGRAADAAYESIHPATGELIKRTSEFAHYSLKPGIGYQWFQKYHSSVYPHDYVIFNGKKVRPPRYYDKLYERMTGQKFIRDTSLSDGRIIGYDTLFASSDFEAIKHSRWESAQKHLDDNTPSRLLVKEQVQLARISGLKRKLT